jgi:ABC-type lipoprotein export system ATPase subunit
MEENMSSVAAVEPGLFDLTALAQEQVKTGTIIQATNVHKVYNSTQVKVYALKGVDLSIRRGEMVAPIHEMSDKKRTRCRAEKMGFVFQFFNLLPVLTAVENVELPLLVAGVKQGEARKRSLEALNLVGLTPEAHKRPAAMSGGQQQRVTIARALVNEPAIVWADEPTGNLDSETAGDVMALLCRLNKEKSQTFVLVTHDPTVARRADRIVRMRDGVIESDQAN